MRAETRVRGGEVWRATGGRAAATTIDGSVTAGTIDTNGSVRGDSSWLDRVTARCVAVTQQQLRSSRAPSVADAVASASGQQQLSSAGAQARALGNPPSTSPSASIPATSERT